VLSITHAFIPGVAAFLSIYGVNVNIPGNAFSSSLSISLNSMSAEDAVNTLMPTEIEAESMVVSMSITPPTVHEADIEFTLFVYPIANRRRLLELRESQPQYWNSISNTWNDVSTTIITGTSTYVTFVITPALAATPGFSWTFVIFTHEHEDIDIPSPRKNLTLNETETPAPPSDDNNNLWIYVGAGGGGGALLILLVIYLYCRSLPEDPENPENPENPEDDEQKREYNSQYQTYHNIPIGTSKMFAGITIGDFAEAPKRNIDWKHR
jgi:hypothetical protein